MILFFELLEADLITLIFEQENSASAVTCPCPIAPVQYNL